MRLQKLVIENYKSFQYPTEIVFPLSADGKSIFLIGGMNAAGKSSIMEAIKICLYGEKSEVIFKGINRKEFAKGNTLVSFQLTFETDELSTITVQRSWSVDPGDDLKPKALGEKLSVVRDGKRVTVENKDLWQDFIRSAIPPGITQFFFFDGEKIQEIAADDHSEVRLKSSLEAALGIEYITKLSSDLLYIKQEERKGFVEISDEDLEFKQSELKRERSKLVRNKEERDDVQADLNQFKDQHENARKRFQAMFNMEPESRESVRESDRRRIQVSNRLGQVESDLKKLCEDYLPLALASRLFGGIKAQIESERESSQYDAIRENAATLARDIVRVVEEPEPIYTERLAPGKMKELEKRIYHLLRTGYSTSEATKVLNLSERDAARVLHRIEELESGEVILITHGLDEKRELEDELRRLDSTSETSLTSESERELFEQLQGEMESLSVQIGRKSEQLCTLEDEMLSLEKRIRDIEAEISKLYENHNVSREKANFMRECDSLVNLLSELTVRLRKNKVHLLQEKTLEMYRLLSSKSDLIKDLAIDDETYEITIQDRNGHEIRKSGLSAGEKEIFAVSLLWGLAQTSQFRLPIIIDTPLSRLDSAHRDNIINNYFPNAGDQVVILSTDTEIDKDYYRQLRPHLSGAAILVFDQRQEFTSVKEGYFWEG